MTTDPLQIDWRALMVRYIAAVCEAGGANFLDQIPGITPDEELAVAELEPEWLAVLNPEPFRVGWDESD